MYAVIQIGGHQYKVAIGQQITVDRLPHQVGETLSFSPLLIADGDKVTLGQPAAKIPVKAKVVKHVSGEKVNIIRFKAKSRYTRRRGFRPDLTVLEVTVIGETKINQLSTKPVDKKLVQARSVTLKKAVKPKSKLSKSKTSV